MTLSKYYFAGMLIFFYHRSYGGAVISCRPVPPLQFQPAGMQMISSKMDAKAAAEGKVFTGFIYDDNTSGKRELRTLYQSGRDRHFLGCGKKVCGGAFSGHNTHFAEGEGAAIRCLLDAGSAFQMKAKSVGWVARSRKKLHEVSQPILDAVRKTFGHEINLNLKHFAKVLADRENPLKWDARRNNCQVFSTTLLKGLPIQNIFQPFPKNFSHDEEVRNKKDWPSPRYSLSFGPSIDTPIALLRPQPRSLIWNFYHKKRDNCDIIEFGEAYRTKPCAFPTESWEVLDGIEDTETTKTSLVDALWSLPRDSVSILHTHLLRGSSQYSNADQKALTKKQWVQNRLRVLHQLDVFASLTGGLAAAFMEQAVDKHHLFSKCYPISAEEFGILHVEESIVVLGVVGDFLIYFVSGRERNWHKQEMKHSVRKLREKWRASGSSERLGG
jgi:hypothetical protein